LGNRAAKPEYRLSRQIARAPLPGSPNSFGTPPTGVTGGGSGGPRRDGASRHGPFHGTPRMSAAGEMVEARDKQRPATACEPQANCYVKKSGVCGKRLERGNETRSELGLPECGPSCFGHRAHIFDVACSEHVRTWRKGRRSRLQRSACEETRSVEPLKVGES
jgi:hypothetical protein